MSLYRDADPPLDDQMMPNLKITSRLPFPVPAVCMAVAATLAACGDAGSQPPAGMPPPEVTVVTATPQTLPVSFEYVGQTAGSREAEIRARVTGVLLKRNYREGAVVAAGQSLFTVDPAPFEAALARAEADLASAQARAELAQRNAARMRPLFAAKAVSQKEHDDAVSGEAVAAAELKSARARLAEAELNLKYTRVESPIAGVAGRALRSEGNYVSGPDVLLTTVTQTNPIFVLFGIPDEERLKLNREVAAGRLKLPKNSHFSVSVKLAEGTSYAHTGRVNFSDVHISSQTGTSEMRAELPNPQGLLRPGQFVRVTLTGAQRVGVIALPQRAVLEGPQGKSVYVVTADNKAEARAVTVGDWFADQWVVNTGVNAGDRVIVDGVMKIGPGAPVRIAQAPVPAANKESKPTPTPAPAPKKPATTPAPNKPPAAPAKPGAGGDAGGAARS